MINCIEYFRKVKKATRKFLDSIKSCIGGLNKHSRRSGSRKLFSLKQRSPLGVQPRKGSVKFTQLVVVPKEPIFSNLLAEHGKFCYLYLK